MELKETMIDRATDYMSKQDELINLLLEVYKNYGPHEPPDKDPVIKLKEEAEHLYITLVRSGFFLYINNKGE